MEDMEVEDGSTGHIDAVRHMGGADLAGGHHEKADPNVLGEGDIEGRLKEIRGKVPSFILNDLKKSLTGRMLTSRQLSRIIERTLREYHEKNKGGLNTGVDFTAQLAEMNEKIEMLVNAIAPPADNAKTHVSGDKGMSKGRDTAAAAGTTGTVGAVGNEDNKIAIDNINEIRKQIDGISPTSFLFRDDNGRAKLCDIPEDVVSIMVSLKWLEFLIEKAGVSNMPDVLEFYCDLNWISENTLSRLMRYSKGTKPLNENHDGHGDDNGVEEKLSARDHIMSLLFIERLRGNRISQDVLEQLERELKKIRRGVEELYGV